MNSNVMFFYRALKSTSNEVAPSPRKMKFQVYTHDDPAASIVTVHARSSEVSRLHHVVGSRFPTDSTRTRSLRRLLLLSDAMMTTVHRADADTYDAK
jgi:hypothetical protein